MCELSVEYPLPVRLVKSLDDLPQEVDGAEQRRGKTRVHEILQRRALERLVNEQ